MGTSAVLSGREVRGMFFKRLEETTIASWAQMLSHMFDSDEASSVYRFLGQTPALAEWLGSRKQKEPKAYALTVINRKFEASVRFEVDDLRRDKTGQIRVRIGDLASRSALLPQQLLTTLIAGNGTAYDGTAMFADRSSLKTGGQIDNDLALTAATGTDPTTDEMKTGILNSIETLLSALDDEDQPLNEFAKSFAVMVPPNYWGALVAALKDQFTSAGVSNTLQAVQGGQGFTITPIVNPRLTDATKFYTFRTDADVKPLIWQDELATDLDELGAGSDYEYFNDAHQYGVKRIGNAAFGEPGMATLTTVS